MLAFNELSMAARGGRVRFVAALAEASPEACPNTALMVRRELMESGALDDPERIRELVFDIDEFIPIGYWADLFLARYGLGIDDVRISNLPSPAAIEALRSGAIDVTLEGEPFISILQQQDDAVIWERSDAVAPNWVVAMVMFGPTLIDERPEVGERLMVALLKAIRQFREGNTERNRPIVAAGTGLTPEQLDGVCWPWVSADARIDPEVFRGYQEWYMERGLLDRAVTDEQLFDDRFIDHANEVLGEPDGSGAH
ncbi:MAG: ABC transporter substrate-binding protein, partial [Acidobacteriota bacterium]|jgi:ABC-type nitrate/sulfonate/bicarbonate transport system substrate-binding protein